MSKPVKSGRKPVQVILGVVLVALAFAGVLLFSRLSGGGGAPAASAGARIVGAKNDIKTGARVTAADLTIIKVDVLPTGALLDIASAENKIARQDIPSGQPVLDSELASPAIGTPAKLYFTLAAGTVALNIPAGDISPYVQPGDQIDIIASLRASGAGAGNQTKATLKGLKVISVGIPGTPTAGNLVVQVKLQDAEALEFLVKNTEFTYVLKSPLDTAATDPTTSGVDLPTFKTLFGFR